MPDALASRPKYASCSGTSAASILLGELRECTGELVKLGITILQAAVSKYIAAHQIAVDDKLVAFRNGPTDP